MRGSTAALCTAVLLGLCSGSALADPTEVSVRIEGRTKTLFEGPVLTDEHDVSSYKADGGNAAEDLAEHPCDGINPLDPQNAEPGPTPTTAAVDAMSSIGETDALAGQWYPGFNDYFVKQWGTDPEDAEAEGRSWGILVNNVFTNVGGCQYQLDKGDEALWVYNAFEARPFLALFAADAHYSSGARPLTASAQLGKPFEVEVLDYDDDIEDEPPTTPERAGAEPMSGAVVAPVSTSPTGVETLELDSSAAVRTDAEGKARITFTTPGWHRLKAGSEIEPGTREEETIRSNRLDVCVPPEGASGCGEPPAEDRARVSTSHAGTPEAPNEGDTSASNQPPGTPSITTTGSGQTPAAKTSHLAPSVAVKSIGHGRLVLDISTGGLITVRIARLTAAGHHVRWHAVTTLRVRASKAGMLTIRLPRLRAGNYRTSISLAGARTVTRALVVAGRRR